MVANISEKDGRLEAMTAMIPAWWDSKKEYVLDHFPHSGEIWGEGGVLHNVEYEKRPIFDEEGQEIPGYKRSVRVDTGETISAGMTDRWQIVQPRQAFDWLDGLVQDGIMRYTSAGVLDGGKKVWILANIPGVAENPVDSHRPYILWADDFTGKGSLFAYPCMTRVVCENTLSMAMRERDKSTFRGIRHTGVMEDKLASVFETIAESQAAFAAYNADSARLASVEFTMDDARAYVDHLFPVPLDENGKPKEKASATIRERKMQAVRDGLVFERRNAPDTATSWWGLVNAVTHAVDHGNLLTFKGQDDKKTGNAFKSRMFGTGAQIKANAIDTAMAMIG